MDINRNNYESFFLLYVDGELGVADKKAVEAFVRQNPDLQEELNMLQQTVLPAPSYTFTRKSTLYKNSEPVPKELLLYLDNELAPAEAKILEQQLAANGALQKEWAILQQTQLSKEENIQFANKESLYRREPGRIIAAKWWRIAAAALLLGFGIWGGIAVMNNSGSNSNAITGETATVVNTNTDNSKTVLNGHTEDNNAATADIDSNEAAPTADAPLSNNMAITAPVKTISKKETIPARWSSEPGIVNGQNDLERLTKETKKTVSEKFNTDNGNEIATNNVTPTNRELEPVVSSPIERINAENMTNTDKVLKNNAAAYTGNDIKAVGATDSYLATSNKKTRRSGLLRKVTRFFQRSINNRGEGDGLKIAGFEFAVK